MTKEGQWYQNSKAAERSRRQRDITSVIQGTDEAIMSECTVGLFQWSYESVGRLVRNWGLRKTIGEKVISKSRFFNTFNYFGYEREVGNWPVVGKFVFVYRVGFLRSGEMTDSLRIGWKWLRWETDWRCCMLGIMTYSLRRESESDWLLLRHLKNFSFRCKLKGGKLEGEVEEEDGECVSMK